MKKIAIILLVLFLGAEVTYGQFNLGIKAGYTSNKLSSDIDVITAQAKSGFIAGAWARIGKRVYLQPEFVYNMGSSVFKQDSVNVNNWEQKVTISSLGIPVLVGVKIIDTKLFNLRAMAGPEISFVVNSKVENTSLTGPIQTDDVNKVNWYFQAGAGIDVLFLTLDIRYKWGINYIINDINQDLGSTATPYPLNSRNNMFEVSVGWKIF